MRSCRSQSRSAMIEGKGVGPCGSDHRSWDNFPIESSRSLMNPISDCSSLILMLMPLPVNLSTPGFNVVYIDNIHKVNPPDFPAGKSGFVYPFIPEMVRVPDVSAYDMHPAWTCHEPVPENSGKIIGAVSHRGLTPASVSEKFRPSVPSDCAT